jgi:5-formyltetrahydrofolate cyclo-ligase
MSATNQAKKTARALIDERLARLGGEERGLADQRVCRAVESLRDYEAAQQVVAYLALRDEVCMRSLLAAAVASGKQVYVPVVGPAGTLTFSRWLPESKLKRSDLGVEEPLTGDSPQARPTLSIIPGRAFDRSLNRLGRGGGYYDRAMSELERLGPTVGVAYECQLVDSVPTDSTDRPVGLLVTDAAVYRANAD